MAGKLRDINFTLNTATIMSFEPETRIRLKWCIGKTAQNLSNLKFFIDRGESPEDLKQIAGPIASDELYEYIDYTGLLRNTEKLYYYKIRGVEFSADTPVQTFETKPFHWEGEPDLTAMYIIDEHLFAFRHVHGVPTLIFKKKTEGARCPECWDTVLKRVTKSSCLTCYGTGFANGYYKHIEAWMDFNPDPKVVSISEFGERQPSQTDVLFTNYPQMASGDVIVEMQGNKYWRVSNVRNTEKNRTTILQVMRIDEINRSDVELHLTVPEDVRLRLLRELRQRESRPEF